MTLTVLAECRGSSHSTLSQIENTDVSQAAETLGQLLAAA